jgi:hypothetical protein
VSLAFCLAASAAPKHRSWQDAQLVKIQQSVTETDSPVYSPSIGTGSYPADTTGVERRHTRIWTYAFKTSKHLYTGKAARKPLKNIKEGDQVRIAVDRRELYVIAPTGKEQKLELLKPE